MVHQIRNNLPLTNISSPHIAQDAPLLKLIHPIFPKSNTVWEVNLWSSSYHSNSVKFLLQPPFSQLHTLPLVSRGANCVLINRDWLYWSSNHTINDSYGTFEIDMLVSPNEIAIPALEVECPWIARWIYGITLRQDLTIIRYQLKDKAHISYYTDGSWTLTVIDVDEQLQLWE